MFADHFEEYFKLLSDYVNIQTTKALISNDTFESIYMLIANIRKQIKQINSFVEIFYDKINVIDRTIIKDDRIAITLESIKNLLNTKNTAKNKNYKPLLMLRIFGCPTFLCSVLAIFIAIPIGIIKYNAFDRKILEIEYLYDISLDLYNETRQSLINEYVHQISDLIRNTALFMSILIGISLLYRIIFKMILKKFENKKNLSAGFKYYISWFYIDSGISIFKLNYERHKILIIEAAEEGHIDAILRLGDLYANGFLGSRKNSETRIKNLKISMEYYKIAFPNKKAVKKYNRIEKKLKGKK